MIPGHLPQAWHKPRGVPIPWNQVSFVGEDDDGGGNELLASLFFSSLCLRLKLSSQRSSFSSSSFKIFLHKAALLSCRKRGGISSKSVPSSSSENQKYGKVFLKTFGSRGQRETGLSSSESWDDMISDLLENSKMDEQKISLWYGG